jgi:hypothetical protein
MQQEVREGPAFMGTEVEAKAVHDVMVRRMADVLRRAAMTAGMTQDDPWLVDAVKVWEERANALPARGPKCEACE